MYAINSYFDYPFVDVLSEVAETLCKTQKFVVINQYGDKVPYKLTVSFTQKKLILTINDNDSTNYTLQELESDVLKVVEVGLGNLSAIEAFTIEVIDAEKDERCGYYKPSINKEFIVVPLSAEYENTTLNVLAETEKKLKEDAKNSKKVTDFDYAKADLEVAMTNFICANLELKNKCSAYLAHTDASDTIKKRLETKSKIISATAWGMFSAVTLQNHDK